MPLRTNCVNTLFLGITTIPPLLVFSVCRDCLVFLVLLHVYMYKRLVVHRFASPSAQHAPFDTRCN